MDKDNLILIGEIVSAVGIKGEVKVYTYSDNWSNYEEGASIYMQSDKETRLVKIEGQRFQKGLPVIKIKGILDRNEAELLVSNKLFIDANNLEELPEDTFYIRDLIGCKINEIKDGYIGELIDITQNTGQDLYKVKTENNKELYIPAVKEFIRKVDLQNKVIYIELIPGFME
ncbi:MAG TPA: ribosome maturation factor RimM [Anaerovoracaceae bacterium]|nr:ribosome maturation factor RimM [Anaerovoracaceae bacterium]